MHSEKSLDVCSLNSFVCFCITKKQEPSRLVRAVEYTDSSLESSKTSQRVSWDVIQESSYDEVLEVWGIYHSSLTRSMDTMFSHLIMCKQMTDVNWNCELYVTIIEII